MNASVQNNKSLDRMAVFVEHFPPFLGSDRSIYELAVRAAKNGIKVKFIALQPLRYLLGRRPKDWSYKRNWSHPPTSVHPNVTAEYILTGPLIERMWRAMMPIAYLLTLCLFVIRSFKVLLSFGPRIVVAAHATPLLGVVASICTMLIRRPLVMGCPDWMAAYAAGLAGEGFNQITPRMMHWLEIQLYRHASAVYVVTNYLRRLLVNNGVQLNKIYFVPNAVDTMMFSPDVDGSKVRERYGLSNACVILLTGHLEEWAGISLLYRLAQRLEREFPSAVILLVGEGESITELISEFERQDLRHRVVCTGHQPYEDMPTFVAAADIALCMFPDTPLSHAASPLKLYEYMSAAKAVVVTQVQGSVELLSPGTSILVPPGSPDAVCDAVIELCRNEHLRRELGQRARAAVVDRYDWNKIFNEFLRCCHSTLKSFNAQVR